MALMVFAIGVPVQLFWEGFFIGVAGLYAAACPSARTLS